MADTAKALHCRARTLALADIAVRLQSVRRTVFLAREAALGEETDLARTVPGKLAIAIHGIDDINDVLRGLGAVTDGTEEVPRG